jgi:hypothetical protein
MGLFMALLWVIIVYGDIIRRVVISLGIGIVIFLVILFCDERLRQRELDQALRRYHERDAKRIKALQRLKRQLEY